MPDIWVISQKYHPWILSEHGRAIQPSFIRAVLVAGYWSECNSLLQMRCLHVAWRQQHALMRYGEPHRCAEALGDGWPHTPQQPLAVAQSPCPSLHTPMHLSISLLLTSEVPRTSPPTPHRSSSGCWWMLSGTYGRLKPLHEVRWEQQKLGQGLADGRAVSGLTGSWAGRGRGTARCAQGVLEQPGSTTTFKFFHFQSFPLH